MEKIHGEFPHSWKKDTADNGREISQMQHFTGSAINLLRQKIISSLYVALQRLSHRGLTVCSGRRTQSAVPEDPRIHNFIGVLHNFFSGSNYCQRQFTWRGTLVIQARPCNYYPLIHTDIMLVKIIDIIKCCWRAGIGETVNSRHTHHLHHNSKAWAFHLKVWYNLSLSRLVWQ